MTTRRDHWPGPVRRSVAAVATILLLLSTAAACSDDDGADPGSVPPTDLEEGATPPRPLCGEVDDLAMARPERIDPTFDHLIPAPALLQGAEGRFEIDETVELVVVDPDAEVAACLLRDELARTTGLQLAVREGAATGTGGAQDPEGDGTVRFVAAEAEQGAVAQGPERGVVSGPGHPEGYRLVVSAADVVVEASAPAGHGWAVQTLLQSMSSGESPDAADSRPVPAVPAGTVTDAPRFAWRGVMIDIARHFFGPEELEGVIDLMARYKLNILHLHLTDDQGWRIAIDAYPALTEVGAANEVGGGSGGYLTKDDYRRVVAYAQRRGITVVPEIDMPGHTNAALVSVPDLTCDGVAPEPYTGTRVGFSSLCIGKPEVTDFVRTVLTELAEMTPGPYLHIGGDESHSTDPEDFDDFIAETMAVVHDLGKIPVGWEEIGRVPADHDRVAQHWLEVETAEAAAEGGASLVLSPSSRLYFDMAYGPFAPAGNDWAGTTDTREVYDWDPVDLVDVAPEVILGLEAPLWTELIDSAEEIDLRLLPRLPALGEVAWSAQDTRNWEDFRDRLAGHGPWWDAIGRSYTRDPLVWQE